MHQNGCGGPSRQMSLSIHRGKTGDSLEEALCRGADDKFDTHASCLSGADIDGIVTWIRLLFIFSPLFFFAGNEPTGGMQVG